MGHWLLAGRGEGVRSQVGAHCHAPVQELEQPTESLFPIPCSLLLTSAHTPHPTPYPLIPSK
jgi:hypothetical protein